MLSMCIYQVLWSQRESRLSKLCDERRLTWLGYRLAKLNSGVHPITSTYEVIFIELSSLYDRICEFSLDSNPPPKFVEAFERIESKGCTISAEISS